MNRKTKSLIIGGTVSLALLTAVAVPHIGQEPAPLPQIRPVSAFTHEDRVIPPPEPTHASVSEEKAKAESDITTVTQIAFEHQKPNATTEILTMKEPLRDKPTPEPVPLRNTAIVMAAEPKMGDTRIVDGQKQMYILGFGWIDDNDEPNVGIVVDGDGDINKMVGIMD